MSKSISNECYEQVKCVEEPSSGSSHEDRENNSQRGKQHCIPGVKGGLP